MSQNASIFMLSSAARVEGVLGLVEVDRGLRALEIVALRDLLAGLIDGVVHFLKIDT